MSGRSTERLIEEILQTDPNRFYWYLLTPIQEWEYLRSSSSSIDFINDWATAKLPPSTTLFNFMSQTLGFHVEIEKMRFFGKCERDWHLLSSDSETKSASMACRTSGAELRITFYERLLTAEFINSFDLSVVKQRMLDHFGSDFEFNNECLNDCFKMFNRIINDIIVVPPLERRSIKANGKPSALLDLHLILPFLGFKFNSEKNTFDPPETANMEYFSWLRRVLLEVESSFKPREVVPELARFLECENFYLVHNEPLKAQYACLGASVSLNDNRLWDRYNLASQQDPGGAPWYLDAISEIAQERQSENLQMQVMSLISLGIPTISTIENQLMKFNLDVSVAAQLTDEELCDLVLTYSRFGGPWGGEQLLKNAQVLRQHLGGADSLSLQRLINIADGNEQVFWADVKGNFLSIWTDPSATKVQKLEALLILRKMAFAENSDASLVALYEQSLPNQTLPSLQAAFGILGVDAGQEAETQDNTIMAMFFAQALEAGPERILELRAAVRTIAKARHSVELLQFLGYDDTDSMGMSSSDSTSSSINELLGKKLPPGLWNIGNTCYLNSLLQFYYSVPAVREYVELTADAEEAEQKQRDKDRREREAAEREAAEQEQEEFNFEDKEKVSLESYEVSDISDMEDAKEEVQEEKEEKEEEEKRPTIGSRKITANEITRSKYFVTLLGKLFNQIGTTKSSHVTPSDILAYMALIRPNEDADVFIERGPSFLRDQLGAALQRQQDVTECIENVLDQLEATMTPEGQDSDGEQIDLIKRLFYGNTLQVLQRVKDGGNRRTKTERYSSLLIDAGDKPGTLYNALDRAFADEILELEEGTTKRTLQIKTLPQILQIQVQRVQFDRVSFMPYKNMNPVIFDDIVYMDRYLVSEENSDLRQRQEECKRLNAELVEVKNEVDLKRADLLARKEAVDTTLDYIKGAPPYYSNSDNSSHSSSDSSDEYMSRKTSPQSSNSSSMTSTNGASEDAEPMEQIQNPTSSSSSLNSTSVNGTSANTSLQASSSSSSSTTSNNYQNEMQDEPPHYAPQYGGVFTPEVNPSTIESLEKRSSELEKELRMQELRVTKLETQIEDLFANYKSHAYRLHALFIHKGDVSYGHYWIYIRHSDGFLKYNDEYVSEVPNEEVFNFVENPATPYFLVFTKMPEINI